jgi:hypothetical protein
MFECMSELSHCNHVIRLDLSLPLRNIRAAAQPFTKTRVQLNINRPTEGLCVRVGSMTNHVLHLRFFCFVVPKLLSILAMAHVYKESIDSFAKCACRPSLSSKLQTSASTFICTKSVPKLLSILAMAHVSFAKCACRPSLFSKLQTSVSTFICTKSVKVRFAFNTSGLQRMGLMASGGLPGQENTLSKGRWFEVPKCNRRRPARADWLRAPNRGKSDVRLTRAGCSGWA